MKKKIVKLKIVESLLKELPRTIKRSDVDHIELLNQFICSRTLANYACRGEGPRYYLSGKKRVVYEREDLVAWLAERLQVINGGA